MLEFLLKKTRMGRKLCASGRVYRSLNAGPGNGKLICFVGNKRDYSFRYGKRFLQATMNPRLQYRIRFRPLQPSLEHLTQLHGLTILDQKTLPAALSPKVLRTPFLVKVIVPLPRDFTCYLDTLPRGLQRGIRRVEKYGYRTEWCIHEKTLDSFYSNYYLPTARKRFGPDGMALDTIQMLRQHHNAGTRFLRLFDGTTCIGMCRVQIHASYMLLHLLGVLDGDRSWVRKDVLTALYLESAREASRLGLKELDMGRCKPFLNDGIMQYKLRWRGYLRHIPDMHPDYFMYLDPAHPAVGPFIREQAPLVVLGGKLTALADPAGYQGNRPLKNTAYYPIHNLPWFCPANGEHGLLDSCGNPVTSSY